MTAREDLRARLARPQRHRLLQGFPALPLLREITAFDDPRRKGGLLARGLDGALLGRHGAWRGDGHGGGGWQEDVPTIHESPWISLDPTRPLLVGVIPHTICTPRVEGCGFCTFPHDRGGSAALRDQVEAARHDVERTFVHHPSLGGRRVAALYFGGGTANLARVPQLDALFGALAAHLDLSGAEVTLEGVPSLFLKGALFGTGSLAWLARLPVRHRRVSLGIQTFDAGQIARMGRSAFGDASTVERVVAKAHRLGFTTSGDFLINLPGQSVAAQLADVREAARLGLDQICVYHLVAYEGLGTAWSENPAILAALPGLDAACANWLAVREELGVLGYVQTTLTNFERKELAGTDRRFLYEELSFTPGSADALGVGPLAISTFVDLATRRAVKHVRRKVAADESWRVAARELWFPYEPEDLDLLFFTRSLPRLEVPRALLRGSGADFFDARREVFDALVDEGLVTLDVHVMRVTPRGMFFADTIAGLVAADRARVLRDASAGRSTRDANEAPITSFMG